MSIKMSVVMLVAKCTSWETLELKQGRVQFTALQRKAQNSAVQANNVPQSSHSLRYLHFHEFLKEDNNFLNFFWWWVELNTWIM